MIWDNQCDNAMRYWLGRKYEKGDVSVIIVDLIAQREYEEKYIIGWELFWKGGNPQFQGLRELFYSRYKIIKDALHCWKASTLNVKCDNILKQFHLLPA